MFPITSTLGEPMTRREAAILTEAKSALALLKSSPSLLIVHLDDNVGDPYIVGIAGNRFMSADLGLEAYKLMIQRGWISPRALNVPVKTDHFAITAAGKKAAFQAMSIDDSRTK